MSSNAHYKELIGVSIIFFAAICYSAKAIFAKLAYEYSVDSLSLLTLRLIFSFPFFLYFALRSVKKTPINSYTKQDLMLLVFLGFIGYYLSSLLDFMGLQYISASLERLILFVYPTIVVLLSSILLKKPITRKELIALVLTYLGIAVIFIYDLQQEKDNILTGCFLVFCSALTYALYLIGSGKLIPKFGSVSFTAYAMVVSTTAAVIHYLISSQVNIWAFDKQVYIILLLMAIFSTVIPAFLYSEGIRLIGSNKVSIVGSIGPVATIFLAHFILGESFSLIQFLGTGLVLTGVITISLKENKKR